MALKQPFVLLAQETKRKWEKLRIAYLGDMKFIQRENREQLQIFRVLLGKRNEARLKPNTNI